MTAAPASIADGDTYYIVNDGKGVAGDVDACGNDMEGVPYIEVSTIQDGTAITWDTSKAGDADSRRRPLWRPDNCRGRHRLQRR